ncbi:g5488 [Coccomyxa elongata]
MAGIPTAPAGETGQRLQMCLRNRPHEFVAVALRELQAAFGRPGASRKSKSAKGDAEQEQRRRGVLEDIIYFWMLAEAYIQHPALQADMRLAQQRECTASALAAGTDPIRLHSRVQLLDEAFQGQYMIGSVRFVRDTPVDTPGLGSVSSSVASQGISWGGSHSDAARLMSGLPRDFVLGSEASGTITPYEADTPTRMSRQGAARAYHTYMNWGYFQRRMAQPREPDSKEASSGSGRDPQEPGLAGADASYAGNACRVWRYFESVPDSMDSMRTREAVAVADRHLRALFGTEEECITSLAAWQHMCTEARWIGRALFDAEDIVLQHTQPPASAL